MFILDWIRLNEGIGSLDDMATQVSSLKDDVCIVFWVEVIFSEFVSACRGD